MRRKRPIIKGNNAKRFKIRSEINQLKRELDTLDFNKCLILDKICELEQKLKIITS